MKYTSVLSLGLAALASASIVERDAAPYKKVVESISSAVDDLDSQVQKYSGGDKKPVLDASDALVQSLDDGKKTIDGLDQLSAGDALPLSQSLDGLNSKSQSLTDDLKSKRGVVEQAGECDAVRKAIEDINTSAQALVKSAVDKIPKGLQNLAQSFVGQFTKSFNETQDYFSEDNCKNGSGGGNSSTASTTTTPSMTNSQSASSPSGSNGSSMLAPAWTLATAMILLAVYH